MTASDVMQDAQTRAAGFAHMTLQHFCMVPAEHRDLAWLMGALQAAVEVEMATIPPYLCAYWSVKDPLDPSSLPAADLLRDIALDEMFHLATVCNLLSGIGGAPLVVARAPRYPGPLPRGIRPGLVVHLQRLTRAYVKQVFMEIEHPGAPVADPGRLRAGAPLTPAEEYETLGAFYEAVADAFADVKPALDPARQLRYGSVQYGPGLVPAEDWQAARDQVLRIKDEGEGARGTAEQPLEPGVLAHYYRFAELHYGRRLVRRPDLWGDRWGYDGDCVPFPDAGRVHPMASVPSGGWPNPPEPVKALIDTFNTRYTDVLRELQDAWPGQGEEALLIAIEKMRGLQDYARPLLETPLGHRPGTYGPEFRATRT